MDFIDTSDIIEMHESRYPSWIDTEEMAFHYDNMFLTVESRDKSGEMLAIRMIPMANIIEVDVGRDDPKLKKSVHKMKQFLKTTIKDSK